MYAADSSDLAAGAAGTATSTVSTPVPSSAGWTAAAGSYPARSWPAIRIVHAWRASATDTYSVTYRRRIRCAPLPRHKAAGPCSPQCRLRLTMSVCAYLRHASPQRVTGLRGPGQCRPRANCVGLRLPPVRDSLPPRRAAGPGAQSVCQGLTVTAAPTPDPPSPSVSPVYGGRVSNSVG